MVKGGGKALVKIEKTIGRRSDLGIDWKKYKDLWEADITINFTTLERLTGVSRQSIGSRAKREEWKRINAKTPKMQRAVKTRADEKSASNPVVVEAIPSEVQASEPSAGAVNAAVEVRAGVLDRHRREWNLPRNRLYAALQENNFDKMKQAKISAEALTLIQNGERKSWGLDGDPTLVVQIIPPGRRDNYE